MDDNDGREDVVRSNRATERKIAIPQSIWDEVGHAAIRQRTTRANFVLIAIRHELFGRPADLEPAASGALAAHGANGKS